MTKLRTFVSRWMDSTQMTEVEEWQAFAANLLEAMPIGVLMTQTDARQIAQKMTLGCFETGESLLSGMEPGGRAERSMMLLLGGEATVLSELPGTDPVVITVLGSGALIGEMALLDDASRSATCVAVSDMSVALLSRQGLHELMETRPIAAGKLLMAVGKQIADRLRQTNEQLKVFRQLNAALTDELSAADPVPAHFKSGPRPVSSRQPPRGT
jgi:CRP/FNR family transcriptional regulator, cyclic AMP receptor protein